MRNIIRFMLYALCFTLLAFCVMHLTSRVQAFPINRDSLDNGLVVLLTEDHKLPMLEIRAVVKTGSVNDPKGREGLANLVSELLIRGTKNRTMDKINTEIEFVGGQLRQFTAKDYSGVNIRVLSKDLDLAVDLLADLMLNSIFPDLEIGKVKKQVVSSIIRTEEEPEEYGSDAFYKLFFPDHPYGHPVVGYTEAVNSITKQDLLEFYQKYYAPNNCFIVAVGDFSRLELLEKIKTKFGRWQKKDIPELKITDPGLLAKPKGKIITKKEINQAYIFLGFLGLKENAPDLLPTRVMNFALGASPTSSRIGVNVREKGGLAYDVRSYFERNLYPGVYFFTTQTKTDNTQTAVDKILVEIRKMRESGATQKELDRAKKFYTGNFPLSFDSFSDKIGIVTRIERYQLGLDYLDKFNERIMSLSLEQINQAAKDHLFPNNYLLVIVGNVTEDDVKLENIDWVKESE
jgi:zinc protease